MYETFRTLKEIGDGIKIVKGANKSINYNPAESNTPYRIYAVLSENNKLKSVTFHDENGMLYKNIDFLHKHESDKPFLHVHTGYEHSKDARYKLTKKEKRVIIKILNELNNWTEEDYK